MNTNFEYEAILKGQIGSSVFALVMIIILAAVLVVVNIKLFSKDLGKVGQTIVNVFIIIVILSSTVVFVSRIYNINQDIKSQSYVTYYGEFTVSQYKEGYVTIKDQGKNINLSGKCDLPGGEYIGTIVYSQASKHILDWEESAN